MPQRLSQFINGSKFLESNIDVYVVDYGTIDANSTNTAAVNNGQIFQKAFDDVYRMRFSSGGAITCTIWCPPGDYYFGDSTKLDLANYYPINFNHPQAANIVVSSTVDLDWTNRPSNSSLSNASTVEDRYTLLADFYQTRFHFAKNGPVGRASYIGLGVRGGGGFVNIGIFGRYGGSPGTFNKSTSIWGRGITGAIRLENCCVHGFGATDSSDPYDGIAINGWGLGAEGAGSEIQAVNLQVVDCMRGYLAEQNGTIKTFGDCCVIHNLSDGITAVDGASIYFAGEGSGYISNYGYYGAFAYSGGIIRFGNILPISPKVHTVASGGIYSLRVDTKGLITGQSGKVSYSNSQNVSGGDGMIAFR